MSGASASRVFQSLSSLSCTVRLSAEASASISISSGVIRGEFWVMNVVPVGVLGPLLTSVEADGAIVAVEEIEFSVDNGGGGGGSEGSLSMYICGDAGGRADRRV